MGQIFNPRPVKLLAGLITSVPDLVGEAESRLSEKYGPIDLRSEPFAFDLTHYYDTEMGSPLWRFFLTFTELIDPSLLKDIKIFTNQLEGEFAATYKEVPRPINIDPGYIEESKIVLASTKNFYHRIFLANGIYAEVTLHYESGGWRSFPWTFPDFRDGRYDSFLSRARTVYRTQIKPIDR